MAEVTMTTRRPEVPMADFAFCIEFARNEGPASRVFAATHDFIKACERLDRELINSIDSSIETVLVLEDVEASSLKTYLKTVLEQVDDQALKDIDWKPLIGQYLVKAKYLVLEWLDCDDEPKRLMPLARDIQDAAKDTNVKHLPDYLPPSPEALLNAARDFQVVKDHLLERDAAYVSSDGLRHDMNLSIRIDIESIEEMAIKESLKAQVPSMVFIVKKPDYIGDSRWDFRHGRRAISAKIEDTEWLSLFQGRHVEVRPGDALRCKTRIEMDYGIDNELVAERFYVEEVLEVVENQYQISLFDVGES